MLATTDIKSAANQKIAALKAEATDTAVATVWSKTMGWATPVAAGMAVTSPLGAIAGLAGIAVWMTGAACIGVAGLLYCKRTSEDLYDGELDPLDYLTDEDYQQFLDRTAKVKAIAEEALKKPEPSTASTAPGTIPPIEVGATPTTQPVDRLLWRDGEHLVLIGLSGSGKTTALMDCVPTTAPVLYITLKSDDKAPEGWQAYRLRKFADRAFLSQLDDLCSMLMSLVQARKNHRLIIDEALTILDQARDAQKTLTEKEDKADFGSVAARFEGLLKMYIRTGRSDGHWLGLVTQSPNGTDLFGSAKTMQGLKTVLCAGEASSNKFDYVVAWAKQLYGQFVTNADEQKLFTIQAGFWHFWVENGQIQYRATPQSNRALLGIPMLDKYQPQQPPAAKPAPTADTDWQQTGAALLAFEGESLRKAAASLLGQMSMPAWQAWRDEFKSVLPTLDVDLQDALRNKFPNVLL